VRIRLTVEICAADDEQARRQVLWLRYMERSGLLGAKLQALFECEDCEDTDWLERAQAEGYVPKSARA
jgi:hypothetical protein